MAGKSGKPAIQVSGATELRKSLRRMQSDLADFTSVNKASADLVAQSARQKVPVDSGLLQSTIEARATKTTGRVVAGKGPRSKAGTKKRPSKSWVPYAGPIHFGWFRRGIEPNPFLYDALDDRKDDVIRKYEDQVGNIVRKVDDRTPG
jgi:hypothetical protein